MTSPVNKRSTSGSRSFDYCRFIELDYTPMEADIMVSMRQSRGFLTPKSPDRHCRRSPAPVSNRDPYGNASLSSSSNSGSCKGSDCSPTPRRHMKYTSCTDNHGIKPPPPEQYLTPLQQKEVCIRHLRARLKETVERLQDRDTEIDELRTQLSRMQEDWIEEECHRVEAQLALKEARREIQQLKQVIDVVRTSMGEADSGVQKCFQDITVQNHKLDTLLQSMEIAQAGVAKVVEASGGGGAVGAGPWVGEGSVGSCEGSPARSVTRSSTYTKLSEMVPPEHNESGSGSDVACCLSAEGTQDSGFVCCGEMDVGRVTRAELLLEAACLSEETASLLNACSHLPHSATYEELCCGETRMLPLRCSLGRTTGGEAAMSISHPCLSHHHLYLHHLREQSIQTECDSGPASAPVHGATFGSDLDTIAEVRTFRSQACSPTSTWLSDEGDDLDSVTTESVITATAGGKPIFTETVSTESSLTLGAKTFAAAETCNKLSTTTEFAGTMAVVDDSVAVLPTATVMPDADSELNCSTQGLPTSPDSVSCPVPLMPFVEKNGEPTPQITQPQHEASQVNISGVTIVEVDDDNEEDKDEEAASAKDSGCEVPVKSYWSRHFLVDLLAVAVPVVPTVAWLCRGPRRVGQPMYHIGALLRGCCTVALHSLRRGGGLRHYPAGGGGPGGINI
ncbi:syntaphilin isoform X2 [Clarias gariepinus]|uniref:syntaphilin isoform X2 n=1 Tax=Clarias gariepinus TaxID=13013 RepID=UPI00234C33F1|nr:syntaphilin isoform X2 [Clarias gariepinus]